MLEQVVEEIDELCFDEHILLFLDTGSYESRQLWEGVARLVERVRDGRDFVLVHSVCPAGIHTVQMAHLYDHTEQRRFEGSDDIADFLRDFIRCKHRMSYVRKFRNR